MWSKLCTTATCDDWWVYQHSDPAFQQLPDLLPVIVILNILSINTDNSVMKCLHQGKLFTLFMAIRLKVSKVMHSKQPLSYSLQLLLYRLAVQLFAVCSNFSVYLEMCCLSVRLPRRLNHITMYTIECSIILFIGTMLMLHRKLINMATPSWSISTQMLI